MTIYKYVSIDQQGKTQKGILEGHSLYEIRQKLKAMNVTPLEIMAIKSKISLSKLFLLSSFRRKSISLSRLALLTYQLSALLSVGLPIDIALKNISEQVDDPNLKNALLTIRSRILEGFSLSRAMDEYSDLFPFLYRTTIVAGEKTGNLEHVVNRLALFLEEQVGINQKIQHALIYPALLTIVSVIIIGFLLAYVMPKITAVFLQSNQTIPTITVLLLNISEFLKSFWLYILFTMIILGIAIKILFKNERINYSWHVFLLKIPFIHSAITIINTTRFLRAFSILLIANVPILESMRVANDAVVIKPIKNAIEKAKTHVSEGIPIHQALYKTCYFSHLVTQLIASGETSGKLGTMIEKIANYQEKNVSRWISTALSLFEPTLIIIMGMLVLFIVLAILLPIFQLNQFMG